MIECRKSTRFLALHRRRLLAQSPAPQFSPLIDDYAVMEDETMRMVDLDLELAKADPEPQPE